MIVKEIKSACNCVDALVRDRNDDEFMWEDAIAELCISPDIGVVVLALLNTKENLCSEDVCRKVKRFLQ